MVYKQFVSNNEELVNVYTFETSYVFQITSNL